MFSVQNYSRKFLNPTLITVFWSFVIIPGHMPIIVTKATMPILMGLLPILDFATTH
jgi:hypothetical protein